MVEYGICMLSVVPMRAQASDRAEQVTQLLFGECYEVLQAQGNWLQVELASDHYRGWMDIKQHTPVATEYYERWCNTRHPRALDLVQFIATPDSRYPVGIGSYLPFYDGTNLHIDGNLYGYDGQASGVTGTADGAALVQVAGLFIKAPYQWGGKSVFGIDCSGFVQQVFGMCGIQLPRDAYQQAEVGEEVHFATQTQAGDLAFFSNAEGRIVHVGLLLGQQQIMHAHGEVRIDTLDHNGIYNSSRKKYSHQLRIIKRIVS
ncbi:C40 family peptidase [Botryobacter ruber]|uniref:C40 family peptidase n=1 Tax=Botryobacter ruber TaxID=2171629 RepID=UPI001F0CA5E5|nr:C40 family peptidase [Botryobacter ruber]